MTGPTPRYGFTLIELLVVMAIIAIAATLIGPVALNQYQRSQQTAERETLLRLLDHYTFTAYSHNQSFTLLADGPKIVIHKGLPPLDKWREGSAGAGLVQALEFEFLRFPQQQMVLNRHGFWQPAVLEWREGERAQNTTLNMALVESGGDDAPRE
ncbi:type II secretion system protein [Pseudidiomarina insulisalsae]|uniref:Type II secretion system protein n=1 Tax=Pseudidiomarina insulisalsae TaxID=575789 RepID=A0A432YNW6_9GAMM|nr:type II secretion system protein [Pseudidiomarina insulisalsae]RUO62598.1 hypothetical protein CWI71_03975 [Pseudidiomarina insulisalsae]